MYKTKGELIMIRKATTKDLNAIESSYLEHFIHEQTHKAYTVFKEGVYPTKNDAKKALNQDALYVYEDNDEIFASMIFNSIQPEEYQKIPWPSEQSNPVSSDQLRVIHLLMVRPSAAGKGIGVAMVKEALLIAKKENCHVVRLDTGSQNIPASSLYQKMGFQLIAAQPMKVGGMIAHKKHLFFEYIL